MRISSNKLAFAIIGLVLIVSGCTSNNQDSSQVTISQEKGVVIQSFSSPRPNVRPDQKTGLQLTIQNKGGAVAKDVRAKIYNIPKGGDGWTTTDSWSMLIDSQLKPANPSTGRQARELPVQWQITAPNMDTSVPVPYDFDLKLYYDYSTEGVTRVQAMGKSTFDDSGVSFSLPAVDNTGGPVQLSATTQTPLVFFEDDASSKTEDFCVKAENVGGGTVLHPYAKNGNSYIEKSDFKDKLSVTVKTLGQDFGFGDDDIGGPKNITMIDGNSGHTCFSLKVMKITDEEMKTTVPIKINADYNYFDTSSTRLTVESDN
ncbi:MAG: hypothetical protein ABEJ69_02605 [Candidatus Nanohaloarchaea archaeon]